MYVIRCVFFVFRPHSSLLQGHFSVNGTAPVLTLDENVYGSSDDPIVFSGHYDPEGSVTFEYVTVAVTPSILFTKAHYVELFNFNVDHSSMGPNSVPVIRVDNQDPGYCATDLYLERLVSYGSWRHGITIADGSGLSGCGVYKFEV
jgi:hypothetical protein